MKVIETVRLNRDNTVTEVSWGNAITSDLSVIGSVVDILEHVRARKGGDLHPALEGRFTTLSIRIELED